MYYYFRSGDTDLSPGWTGYAALPEQERATASSAIANVVHQRSIPFLLPSWGTQTLLPDQSGRICPSTLLSELDAQLASANVPDAGHAYR